MRMAYGHTFKIVYAIVISSILSSCMTRAPIRPYNPSTDHEALIEIFNQNWYWLDYRSQDEGLRTFKHDLDSLTTVGDFGETLPLSWLVYATGSHINGFAAYCQKSPTVGKILFLATNTKDRRRGYAQQLLQAALDEFKRTGVLSVDLATRVTNTPAQTLYKKFGFVETQRDDTFVYFTKQL